MTVAKLVTAQLLAQTHARFMHTAPRAYVDDMAQTAICLKHAALAKALQPAALHFAGEPAKMGL